MTDLSQTRKQPGKGLRIALALSVALNLAVVGVVAGALLRNGPGMRPLMVRDVGFGPYSEALSPQDRRAFRREMFDRAPDIRDARRMMRDDMQALLALLRADPFDAAALTARMNGLHDRLARQLRLGQDVLQEFILAMPPESRRAFADRLEAILLQQDDKHGLKDGHMKGKKN